MLFKIGCLLETSRGGLGAHVSFPLPPKTKPKTRAFPNSQDLDQFLLHTNSSFLCDCVVLSLLGTIICRQE